MQYGIQPRLHRTTGQYMAPQHKQCARVWHPRPSLFLTSIPAHRRVPLSTPHAQPRSRRRRHRQTAPARNLRSGYRAQCLAETLPWHRPSGPQPTPKRFQPGHTSGNEFDARSPERPVQHPRPPSRGHGCRSRHHVHRLTPGHSSATHRYRH